MANINRWVGQRGMSVANQIANMPTVRRVDVHQPIAFLQSLYGQPWVRNFILVENGNPVLLAQEIHESAQKRAAEILEPDDYAPDSVYWQARAEHDLRAMKATMDGERYQEWLDAVVDGLDTWRSLATKVSDALVAELERAACRA